MPPAMLRFADMPSARDEVVQIDAKGTARPIGENAALRMEGRAGRFSILPSPPHLVVLRRFAPKQEEEQRPCLLSGEIRSPGALRDIVGFVGHAGWRGELLILEKSSSRSLYFDQGHVVG